MTFMSRIIRIICLGAILTLLFGCGSKSSNIPLDSPHKSGNRIEKTEKKEPKAKGQIQEKSGLNNTAPIDYDSMSQEERLEAVWGDLIRANGGELKYETLTKEEQALVHFPPFNANKVYWTPKGHNYHSVDWCYTLENSKKILSGTVDEAIDEGKSSSCSKCVGD